MNTTMFLNNVLPLPAARSAHITHAGSSSYDNSFSKNPSIQPDPLQNTQSDNLVKSSSDKNLKTKLTHKTDFKNVFNRQIKSQKPAPQETDVTTPQQNSNTSPDGFQPIVAPVTTSEASTTSPISDITSAGDTTPASGSPTQSVDTSLVQIADIVIVNDPLMPLQNQSQSHLPDSSQQTQPTVSNQPAQNTSQLITSPGKPNAPQQQIVENPVSSQPSVIGNLSSDNSNPDTNLDLKPTDIANYKSPAEGQETQADYPTSARSVHLAIAGPPVGETSLKAGTASRKVQSEIPLSESSTTLPVNIAKTAPAPEPLPSKNHEQNHLIQQPAISNFTRRSESEGGQQSPGSSTNQQSTIINQQFNQPPLSQNKITDSLKKPDTLKADLQNANSSPQIARDMTTPESNANVTYTPPAKTSLESAHNLTSANHDPAAAIREQITQSVTAAAQQLNRQITIQLNPPELGKVSVKFSQAGSELTGLIEASNPRTRADINQQIPEILRSLEQTGVTVKRIDVTLSDLPGRSNHDSQRDNSSQFNWDSHGSGNYHDSPRQHFSSDSFTTPSQYLLTSSQFEPRATSHESLVASSALDILI